MSKIAMLIPERTLGIISALLPMMSIARDSGYSLPTWSRYARLSLVVAGAHKHPTAKAHKHPTKMVMIQNFSFKPAHITIKRGTKVRWINKDSTAHTATSNNGRSFDSGRLGKGQRYTHTFKRTGKQPYHCEIHPHMKGRITVKR